MNRLRLLTIIPILVFSLESEAMPKDRYPVNPGVDIIHYAFHIILSDSTDRIKARAEITAHLDGSLSRLDLDLTGPGLSGKGMEIRRVAAGETTLSWRHENNRAQIDLPASGASNRNLTITIEYEGIPTDGLIISKNKFGDRSFFGDNWPDRARNWLPCVDHPSDKATVEFYITAPAHYKVVANGYLAGEYPAFSPANTGMTVTHWKEDVPIPTKVMVIGVADFAWETAGLSAGIPIQSWVYAKNREAGFTDYRPAPGIVDFYSRLIGPYSYEKLANVQSKTMFGGMENSGCIFYYEGSVTGKNNIQGLLAHEIAHQWFGDAVTEADWHHIWLSEGFATYLEAVYADSLIPGRNLQQSMAHMRKDVVAYFDLTGKPVIDTTITDNMQLLSTNSYQKGAWVLHMLRQEVGDKLFWQGIRAFYAKYRDKNALTGDLCATMGKVAGKDLRPFFRQWLEIPGQPEITWSWKYDRRKRTVTIDLEQTQQQYCFIFDLELEMTGHNNKNTTEANKQVKTITGHFDGRKLQIIQPVDFEVDSVRMDPAVKLLFREKWQAK